MKVALCLLALVACALAFPREQIDVAQLEPRHLWVPAPDHAPVEYRSESRVINGRDAAPGTLTYQAGLIINGRGFCGGSLIRNDFVLTAAHCVDDADDVQVVLGFHDIQQGISQSVLISRIFNVHPQWNPSVLQNDVALVRIPHVNPSIAVSILPLAAANAPAFAGELATLSGWGRTSDESNAIASYLQVVQLEVMTNTRCRLNFLGVIENQHICTFGSNGVQNAGACNGDSGGPLVVGGVQVGIVSFGFARCEAGWPSVFARVSAFRNFIDNVLHSA